MEQYKDLRKDEGGNLEEIIMDNNRYKTMKIRFLPLILTRRIGALKTRSLEG